MTAQRRCVWHGLPIRRSSLEDTEDVLCTEIAWRVTAILYSHTCRRARLDMRESCLSCLMQPAFALLVTLGFSLARRERSKVRGESDPSALNSWTRDPKDRPSSRQAAAASTIQGSDQSPDIRSQASATVCRKRQVCYLVVQKNGQCGPLPSFIGGLCLQLSTHQGLMFLMRWRCGTLGDLEMVGSRYDSSLMVSIETKKKIEAASWPDLRSIYCFVQPA